MARTCIICGGATGSREHLFPAALGGRRTNKGIYCAAHNQAYSPLAAVLSTQLQALNAFLGVQGDHANTVHATTVTEVSSGRTYRLSAAGSEAEPEVLSTTTENGRTKISMTFSSERQIQAWLAEQRAAGLQIVSTTRSPVQQRYLDRGHVSMQLGGAEFLRAIGYVAQTFLAHYFPDVVRLAPIKPFLFGTLDPAAWTQAVWWAREPLDADLAAQAFDFGHRVVVGVDSDSATAYARVSLFSAMHFEVLFGPAPGRPGGCVVVDIDPLAERAPCDLAEQRSARALAPVQPPEAPTAVLSDEVLGGRAQAAFNALMGRISAHHRHRMAEMILSRLEAEQPVGPIACRTFFSTVVDAETQRVVNLMRFVLEGLAGQPGMVAHKAALDAFVAADPGSLNGLTPTATAALMVAKGALIDQFAEDHAAGRLDAHRVGMLLAGGEGAQVVGLALVGVVVKVLSKEA